MRIAVVDGQGGGIGKAIVERLRVEFGDNVSIIALGTNALATSLMLKSGANEGASGENAIVFNANKVDIIVGSIGIIAANAMLGEVSPKMAMALAQSPALKILIPFSRCNIQIAGVANESLLYFIDSLIQSIRNNFNL